MTDVLTKDFMHIAPGAADALKVLGVGTVEAALAYRGGRYAALSSSSETVEITANESALSEIPSIYLKRYRYRRLSHRVRTAFRGGLLGRHRARFEFERLTAMRARGIAAVEPLAFGHRRVRGIVTACFLITRGVPGESLLSFVRRTGTLRAADRQVIARRLAGEIKRMHDAGTVHGSLVWRDILIRRVETGEYEFAFLDPARTGHFRVPGFRRLGFLRDVACIASTAMLLCHRTDRLRFARTYLGHGGFGMRDRLWLRLVSLCAGRRTEQERHRMHVNDMFIATADPPSPDTVPIKPGGT
jgi:hypothetical protein